jgi:segregation and condensation protein A
VEQELEDPRRELVRRLLEFKQYRDAASMLEERGRQWRERFPRLATELPNRPLDPDRQPIREVELWDLVSAFGRVLREKFAGTGPEKIRYDDTPIHVYMQRIHERLRVEQRVAFKSFFVDAVHKSTVAGMFLAVLELLRHRHARATQSDLFGEIWLEEGETPLPDQPYVVVDYEHAAQAAVSPAAAGRQDSRIRHGESSIKSRKKKRGD